jgi:uncharacterized integral membrane protein
VSAGRWLPAAGVTLLAAGFAWLNRGERVPVDLGFFHVYRAPLTVVTFLAFLAGMLSMMVLGLRHDRRVREELRRRGLLDIPPPAQPAASAWGVAREPAPRHDAGADRTAALSRDGDDRTSAFAREDDDDRTIGYPRYDEDPAA